MSDEERRELDEMDLLLGCTGGAAVAVLCLAGALWAVRWLAGQPPVFWGRCAAVAVLALGCGAVAGALARLGRRG